MARKKTFLSKQLSPYVMENISSGNEILDDLTGGLESDVITTLYGPSGSGKTNFCMLATVKHAKQGKVLYIDTEGGFSIERLKQITNEDSKVLNNLIIFKPTNFEEQCNAMQKLKNLIDNKVKLIIFDTISMLYRLELGTKEEVYEVNRALGLQIAQLAEIARKKNIPVLITNQVYSDFEDKEKVNMVGGDLLKYGSKCLIELQRLPDGKRKAILKKHRSLPEGKSQVFEIVQEGVKKSKEGKSFKLFL